MGEWWGGDAGSVPDAARRVAEAVAAEFGPVAAVFDGPGGRVRLATPGVCAGCAAPAVRETAMVLRSDEAAALGERGAVRRGVDRPWRTCKRAGCWAAPVMAGMVFLAYWGRVHGVDVRWPWAARPARKELADMTDAEWVATVAERMRGVRSYPCPVRKMLGKARS